MGAGSTISGHAKSSAGGGAELGGAADVVGADVVGGAGDVVAGPEEGGNPVGADVGRTGTV